MYNRLQKAIRNNLNLYELIFDTHQLRYHSTNEIWYSTEIAPRLYSNLITISEGWVPDDTLQIIDNAYKNQPRKQWSIKDSFAMLNLEDLGFIKRFTAQWIYLDSAKFIPQPQYKQLEYQIIQDEAELTIWKQGWGTYEEPGEEIFLPGLLNLPTVKFIAGYHQGQLLSGCLVNKTDGVFGISNFFSPSDDPGYWTDMLQFIFNEIEKNDVVGYEGDDVLENLKTIGFQSIGRLIVWENSKPQG